MYALIMHDKQQPLTVCCCCCSNIPEIYYMELSLKKRKQEQDPGTREHFSLPPYHPAQA